MMHFRSVTILHVLIFLAAQPASAQSSFWYWPTTCGTEESEFTHGIYEKLFRGPINAQRSILDAKLNEVDQEEAVRTAVLTSADAAYSLVSLYGPNTGEEVAREAFSTLSLSLGLGDGFWKALGAEAIDGVLVYTDPNPVALVHHVSTKVASIVSNFQTIGGIVRVLPQRNTLIAIERVLGLYYYHCGDQDATLNELGIDASYDESQSFLLWAVIQHAKEGGLAGPLGSTILIDSEANIEARLNAIENGIELWRKKIKSMASDDVDPVVGVVAPAVLETSTERQPVRITGGGFGQDVVLRFFDSTGECSPCTSQGEYLTVVDGSTINYNINVGMDAASWEVEVARDGIASNRGYFRVVGGGDETAPAPPVDFNSYPLVWSRDGRFDLVWTNPSDPSGITRVWYKMGGLPDAPDDGFEVELPPGNSLPVTMESEGEEYVHVWLEDGVGNKDHENRVAVPLRHDPDPPVVEIEEPGTDTLETSDGILTLRGAVTDEHSGLAHMRWINSRGGSGSIHFAEGAWTVEGLVLRPGATALGIVAVDRAGNVGYDIIGVQYEADPVVVDDVTVHMTAMPQPVEPGERVTFVITVANTSADALTSVQVRTLVPDYVGGFSDDPTGGRCDGGYCEEGDQIVWEVGTLPAGQSRTFMYSAQLSNDAPGETDIISSATVSADQSGASTGLIAVPLVATSPLTLDFAADRNVAAPGEILTYAVMYANGSDATLAGGTLSVTLPEGLTYLSGIEGASLRGHNVEWGLPGLQPNESGREELLVVVDGGAPEALVLQTRAAMRAEENSDVIAAENVVMTHSAPSMRLSITPDRNPVRPGERVSHQLTVTNSSETAIEDAWLRALVPDYVGGFSDDPTGGRCDGGYCEEGDQIVWEVGTLPAGQSRTFMYSAQLSSDTPDNTLVSSTAVAYAPSAGAAPASASVLVRDAPVLSVGIAPERMYIAAGETTEYRIRYGNASGGDLRGVFLAARLPHGTTAISASAGGQIAGRSVTWEIDRLLPGERGEQSVMLGDNASLMEGDILTGSVTMSSLSKEATASASVASVVQSSPQLNLSLETLPDVVDLVGRITYQLTVTNSSETAIEDVWLRALVPDYVGGFSDDPTGGRCDGGYCEEGDQIVWEVGTLPAGQSRTFMYSAQLSSDVPENTLIYSSAAALAAELGGTHAISYVVANSRTSSPIAATPQQPGSYSLGQSYPNPARHSSRITYALPEPSSVVIEVYDLLGRQVAMLVDAHLPAGTHEVQFDANALASGVYVCRMMAGNFVAAKKVVVAK